MQLYIDIGNSRLKWQSSDKAQSGFLVHGAQALQAYMDVHWGALGPVAACWGCSVVELNLQQQVDQWCTANWGIKVHWVQPSAHLGGVINLYTEPDRLGSDRWVALIGARSLYPNQGVCVVDAGTAITVDALSQAGEFLGGVIIPGRKLMLDALGQSTQHIPHLPSAAQSSDAQSSDAQSSDAQSNMAQVKPDVQARSTAQAVLSGIELLINAGVTRIIQAHLTKYQRPMKILITGGDARSLDLPYAKITQAPDLIFDGLRAVAQVIANQESLK